MSKKTKSKTQVKLAAEGEREAELRDRVLEDVRAGKATFDDLLRLQAEQTGLAVPGFEREQQVQQELFNLLPPEEIAALQAADIRRAGELGGLEEDLFRNQFERLTGGITPQDQALIDEQARRAIEFGTSDIDRATQLAHEVNFEETAPGLGLRRGDTPIQDRAARIAAEGLRQQGQLIGGVRGQAAAQGLQFPLQQSQAVTDQQRLAEASRQFQSQLAQQSFVNRLNLGRQTATTGLGIAQPIGPSGATQLEFQPRGIQTTTRTKSKTSDPLGSALGIIGGIGSLAGGVGGLFTGLGAISQASQSGGGSLFP